ncbi:cyclin-dependent kinase 2-interacting protein isoform X2 [Petaurus breviceps papuanus]|uniref:cyclin-dependent kinase 2-interacting protein isoform X2 n=1 Tax=Petaurus breviceps papuanus TaxID=3040969 RepID=UPI0036DA090B
MDVKNSGLVTPKRTVLSVSARKIKDNAADWHNLLSKWETLNNMGFSVANKIGNIKISALTEDKVELECNSIPSGFHSQKVHPKFNEELEMLCKELHDTLENLAKVQVKMEKLTSTTKGICNLENYHRGNGNYQTPLFHTWPTTYFLIFHVFQMKFPISFQKCTRRKYSSNASLLKSSPMLQTRISF